MRLLCTLLNGAVDQDAVLSAMRTLDTKRYTLNRWAQTHTAPIDANDLHLFLCDERRGKLTAEQADFVRERRAEMRNIYENIVFRLLQPNEMHRQKLVSDVCDFCMTVLDTPFPTGNVADQRQRPQEPLCAILSDGTSQDTPKV